MGFNFSKALNQINNIVEEEVQVFLQNTGGCTTEVKGLAITDISDISGGSTVKDIKNSVLVTMDASCTISQINNSDVSQEVSEKLAQQAESLASGLGLNMADSTNLINNTVALTTVIRDSCIAQVTNLASGTSSIRIAGVKEGSTVADVGQNVIIQSIAKSVVTQVMGSSAGQKVEVQIDQAAKAQAKGLDLTLALILYIVLAIVGAVVFVTMKGTVQQVIMSPMIWMLLMSFPLTGCLIMLIAGIPKKKVMWPYKNAKSNDTADELEEKNKINSSIMLASGVAGGVFLLLELALVGLAMFTIKNPQQPQRLAKRF